MSMLTQINPLLIKIPNFRFAAPFRKINLSVPQKVTALSVTLGVVLIGFLARYLRRRRRVINYNKRGANQRIYSSRGAKSPNGVSNTNIYAIGVKDFTSSAVDESKVNVSRLRERCRNQDAHGLINLCHTHVYI